MRTTTATMKTTTMNKNQPSTLHTRARQHQKLTPFQTLEMKMILKTICSHSTTNSNAQPTITKTTPTTTTTKHIAVEHLKLLEPTFNL